MDMLDVADVSENDFGLAYAPRIFSRKDAGLARMRFVGGGNKNPEISPLLSHLLTEGGYQEVVRDLEADLNDGDDLSFVWDNVLPGGSFSRNLNDNAELLNKLTDYHLSQLGSYNRFSHIQALEASQCYSSQVAVFTGMTQDRSHIPAGCADIVNEILLNSAIEEAYFQVLREDLYREVGLDRYANLVANNAQISYGLLLTPRDKHVGADALALRLGFEMGFPSMTAFLLMDGKGCKHAKKLGEEKLASCAKRYSTYIKKHSNGLEQLTTRLRVKLGLEYAQLTAEDIVLDLPANVPTAPLGNVVNGLTGVLNVGDLIALDDNQLELNLPEVRRLKVNLGVGWVLKDANLAKPLDYGLRTDFGVEYKYFETNPIYKESLKASASITFQLGPVAIPLQAIYYEKSEFEAFGVSPADTVLSAGAQYRFLP